MAFINPIPVAIKVVTPALTVQEVPIEDLISDFNGQTNTENKIFLQELISENAPIQPYLHENHVNFDISGAVVKLEPAASVQPLVDENNSNFDLERAVGKLEGSSFDTELKTEPFPILTLKIVPLELQEEMTLKGAPFCYVCRLTFETDSFLLNHHRSHIFANPFLNSLAFTPDKDVNEELFPFKAIKIYPCKECHLSFNSWNKLMKHLSIHDKEKEKGRPDLKLFYHQGGKRLKPNFKADFVKDATKTPREPKQILVVPKVIRFRCDHCSDSFPFKDLWEQHMLTIHKEREPVQCSTCLKNFIGKNSLRYHMRTHAKKYSFRCLECRKWFHNESNLQKHMDTHNFYQCPTCQMSFDPHMSFECPHLSLSSMPQM